MAMQPYGATKENVLDRRSKVSSPLLMDAGAVPRAIAPLPAFDTGMTSGAIPTTTVAPKPAGMAQTSVKAPAPARAEGLSPEQQEYGSMAGAALQGLSAGAGAVQSADMADASVNVVNSVLQGGVTGLLAGLAKGGIGGGPGAVVGAGVGLVAGIFNAWNGVRKSRETARKQKKLQEAAERRYQEMLKLEKEQMFTDRADKMFDREQQALANMQNVASSQRAAVLDIVSRNQSLKDRYVEKGY